MILRLSVREAATSTSHDVEVTTDPDSRVESLLAALPVRVGDRMCYVGTEWLDPNATIAASPLVHGATISIGEHGPPIHDRPAGAVGTLRVLAGTDAGLVTWLTPGRHDVARSPDAAVPLQDNDVSRKHAQLDVSRSGQVTVVDVGSKNGTTVDGVPVTEPTPLAPEDVLEIGGDRLQWVPQPSARRTTTRGPDARLYFDRAFAPAPAIPRAEIVLPAMETTSSNVTALLLTGLLPLGGGIVMAAILRQPSMLVFAVFGPVAALGTYLVEQRQRRARRRVFTAAKKTAQQQITTSVANEERLRRTLAPGELELTLVATGAGSGLWPRNADSPHGLVLRVGTADRSASLDLSGQPWPGFETPMLRRVPVTVDLRVTGVLGVVGPATPVDALVRWLLLQLGTLRSPDDVRIVVITATDSDELAWTAWLPHVEAGQAAASVCWIGNTDLTREARVAELRDLVASRTAQQRTTTEERVFLEIVVVLDGALSLRHLPGMREVLRDGPAVGVYVICVDRHDMNECRGVCELDGSSLRVTRTRDDQPQTARPEGTSRDIAERLARALAPMRDRLARSGAEPAIPYPLRFLDLLGLKAPTADDILTLWQAHPGPTTRIPVGADGSGPVTVDLAHQGPHTMLGGATGAGKSILLQTLVTSLLLANRPDELNLILVDFKGGSAFLPFERCPHVVALIRSTGETPADTFDDAAAARVLAAVRAEVRRRESLLSRYGGEIDEYWRTRRNTPATEALPRLVMIFDEFARVLDTSPDFLKELVNVAAKGRSLGMHLVLATQSLQGKLTAELKNNIDLRITLRQNEPADSVEVLGVPDAATIPGRLRGRGMILCTKDETRTPRLFQSGYLGNPPPTGHAAQTRVRILEWPDLGAPRPEESVDHGDGPTDQDLAIAAVEQAARRLDLPAPFQPLLPPLPADIALEDLARQASTEAPATAVPFGLIDDPAAQAQPMASLDLAGTDRLLVAGGPQSGRTTFVRTLITSLATRYRPDQAHLYVVERQPAGLAGYAGVSHCGGVFSPAEPDRIRRFVTWLDSEVQRRKIAQFTAAGEPDPRIIVIIDGWEHREPRGPRYGRDVPAYSATGDYPLRRPTRRTRRGPRRAGHAVGKTAEPVLPAAATAISQRGHSPPAPTEPDGQPTHPARTGD